MNSNTHTDSDGWAEQRWQRSLAWAPLESHTEVGHLSWPEAGMSFCNKDRSKGSSSHGFILALSMKSSQSLQAPHYPIYRGGRAGTRQDT